MDVASGLFFFYNGIMKGRSSLMAAQQQSQQSGMWEDEPGDQDVFAEHAPPAVESDDDSDDAVEEVSMSTARAKAREKDAARSAQRHAEKAARSAAQKRREATKTKPSRRARTHIDQDDHLDPAVFAEALTQDDAQDEQLPTASSSRRPRTPKDHVTLRGERTIVRTFDDDDTLADDLEDAPLKHTPLDPRRSLPSARERAYKKQKLALRAKDVRASTIDKPSRSKTNRTRSDDDDPLGLQDPAFLPGGDLYHLTGKQKRRPRSTASRADLVLRDRGAGGRVAMPLSRASMGPATVFARTRRV